MKRTLVFTTNIFKEGKQYVSFNPELEVASCGTTPAEAKENLKEALLGFFSVAKEKGTLARILKDAGYVVSGNSLKNKSLISTEKISLVV